MIAVVLLLISAVAFGNLDVPEVKIDQGALRGKYQESRKGRTFSAFTGIPYAQPPVDELRFKAPLAADPWEGILDASKPHDVCPQSNPITGDFTAIGTEDCLFLNVYTPQLPDSKNQLLPVIFYIHGGGFALGGASPDWYGPDVFLDKDIVLVAPNYRLGALGFLSTGDEVAPGNNGLKDQNLALKWTKNNIAAFGGDPERITIVGHSAGSASAHFQMLSPLSKGLIKGAVAQSGNAVAAWAIAPPGEAVRNAKRLAEFLHCPTVSSGKMIECLRKVNAADIIKQEIKYLEWSLDPMIPFKPVIEPNHEGAFISEHPIDIIKSGKAANIPFMTGITTEEGAIKTSSYFSNPSWIEDFDKEFNRVVPLSLQYDTQVDKDNKSRKLRKFYFGDKTIDNTTKDELTNLYSDVLFLMGADESVRLHSKHSNKPVYYYLFGYRGSKSFSPIFGDPTYNYGVCHADELLYFFILPREFPNYKPTATDNKMTEILTTLWANFATTGNPTPQTDSVISTIWQPVKSENLEYYFIKGPDDIQMAEGLFAERAQFMREVNLYSKENIVKNEL